MRRGRKGRGYSNGNKEVKGSKSKGVIIIIIIHKGDLYVIQKIKMINITTILHSKDRESN